MTREIPKLRSSEFSNDIPTFPVNRLASNEIKIEWVQTSRRQSPLRRRFTDARVLWVYCFFFFERENFKKRKTDTISKTTRTLVSRSIVTDAFGGRGECIAIFYFFEKQIFKKRKTYVISKMTRTLVFTESVRRAIVTSAFGARAARGTRKTV